MESLLPQRSNFGSHLSEPQRQRVGFVGRDAEPSHGAVIISLRLVESVCRQFDIETYEVAGSCAVVDIHIKASGVVHRTMLPRPGSDRQVVTRPKRYQAVAHHGA